MSLAGIDWARPEWLWGLALLPLAAAGLAWGVRRRRAALDAFAEAEVRSRTQRLAASHPVARGALLLVALACLIVAAAGPRWGREKVTAPPVRQQVVYALDVSRSMLAEDVSPSRLERGKLVVRQLLGDLPASESGLVVFAGEATLSVPLTRDAAALALYLDAAEPDWISDPSTDLGAAIDAALDAFGAGPGSGRAIVLLTDGENQVGEVAGATQRARARGVEVDAVGLGTEAGARIPLGDGRWLEADGQTVVTRLDPEPLQTLAEGSDGTYVQPDGPGPGMAALTARLRGLDTGEHGGHASEREAERYRWPLGLALLCLALEAVLRLGPRRRRPGPAAAAVAGLALLAMGHAATPEELYQRGQYSEALEAWRHADRSPGAEPRDSYNRGSAAYRLGEFREAAAGYAVAARTSAEAGREAAAWYNAGDARYRLAQAAESSSRSADAKQRAWDSAVAAFRETLLRRPNDKDAKHNLELALRQRQRSGGGGGGAGGGGGGGAQGGGGGGRGVQPPSSASGGAPQAMSRAEAERLLDALSSREREALARGEEQKRAGQTRAPGW